MKMLAVLSMLIDVQGVRSELSDAWSSYFRADHVLNISWPHGVPHLHLPDTPLMRVAVERLNVVLSEHATLKRFVSIFHAVCRRGATFVDSGANEGFWSLFAAAHGCTAVAIEPQPYCAQLIRAASIRSGVMSRVQLHTMAFTDDTSGKKPCVPLDICKGTASYTQGKVIDIRNQSYSVREAEKCSTVPLGTLDELLPSSTIDLWHLDVEGAELAALRSAKRLLEEKRILRIMIEVDSMQRWRLNVKEKMRIDETLAEVRALFATWTCSSVCDGKPYQLPLHFQWGGSGICPDMYCVAPGVHDVDE